MPAEQKLVFYDFLGVTKRPEPKKPAPVSAGGWCKSCRFGNDSLGYKHLDECPASEK